LQKYMREGSGLRVDSYKVGGLFCKTTKESTISPVHEPDPTAEKGAYLILVVFLFFCIIWLNNYFIERKAKRHKTHMDSVFSQNLELRRLLQQRKQNRVHHHLKLGSSSLQNDKQHLLMN